MAIGAQKNKTINMDFVLLLLEALIFPAPKQAFGAKHHLGGLNKRNLTPENYQMGMLFLKYQEAVQNNPLGDRPMLQATIWTF